MKYIIYTRASTDRDNTITHETQLKDCLKVVGSNEYIHIKDNDVSGDTEFLKRDNLNLALGQLKKGDILLVWASSRLVRDNYILAQILAVVAKKQASVQSFTEPNLFEDGHISELQRTIIVAVAKYELETIRMRIKENLRTAKSRGQVVGNVTYGYEDYEVEEIRQGKSKKVRYLRPNPEEQKTVDKMLELRAQNLTYRDIASELNRLGYRNRLGREWQHNFVRKIILQAPGNRAVHYPEFPSLESQSA